MSSKYMYNRYVDRGYLKGRWCILVCYDVTTKYPVYCVLMDNINGLQLYLLLLYYDFNKCF